MLHDTFPMSERIHRMREELLQAVPALCAERALIYTRTYRENEADPPILKRAKALERTLREMSLFIFRDELIIGNQASCIRGAPVFPEYSCDWIAEEIDEFPCRHGDVFLVDEHMKQVLLEEVVPFWKGKTLYERARSLMPDFAWTAQEIGAISGRGNITSGDGHIIIDYPRILQEGIGSIVRKVEVKRDTLDYLAPGALKKKVFYDASAIVLQAVIHFAERLAALAKQEASLTNDLIRKDELSLIAGNLLKCPLNPPQNFYQAVQAIWLLHLVLQIESNGHSFSLGRVDQYLYPFWKEDVDRGDLSVEKSIELFQSLFLKMFTINKVRPWNHTRFGMGYTTYQNVTIGGQDSFGEDATNELSLLVLQGVGGLRLTQPNLSARYHASSPRSYLHTCAQVIRMGFGMPAMKNDEIIVPSLVEKGVTIEEARDYAIVGCIEAAVPGKWGYRNTGMAFLNALKTLELSLNQGKDPGSGICLLPGPKPDKCEDFEAFYAAFRRQLRYYTDCQVVFDTAADTALEEMVPDALCSVLVNDCLERGKSIKEGGARYDIVSGLFSGLSNLTNALFNIRELVYNRGVLGWATLQEALQHDFSGERFTRVQKMLLHEVPKYGNDVDEVDFLARRILGDHLDDISHYCNTRFGRGPVGGGYCGSTSNISGNVPLGKAVGATPDGRRAGEPIAEGASPFYRTEKNGPTAVMKSVAKLPTIKMIAQLLNLKLSPQVVSTDEDLTKLVDLIITFFRDLKGWHVQFNVIDAVTLREAREHPEKHTDLIVRVAGYSALFVSLDPATQEDIISRTEHVL